MAKINFFKRFSFQFQNYWNAPGGLEVLRLGFIIDDLIFRNQLIEKKLIIAITFFNLSIGIGYKLK